MPCCEGADAFSRLSITSQTTFRSRYQGKKNNNEKEILRRCESVSPSLLPDFRATLHPPACQGHCRCRQSISSVGPLCSGYPPVPPCCCPPQLHEFCRGNLTKNCSSSCLYKNSVLLSLPALHAGLTQGICDICPAVICNNIGIKLASLSCREVSV